MLVMAQGSAWVRARNAFVAAAGMAVLLAMISASEMARTRWELTLEQGNMAGREVIFPAAWFMFLDRPILGWGAQASVYELGKRLGEYHTRDTHNLYLWVLTEDGLLGFIPYFWAVWLCARSAWRSRRLLYGLVPMALLSTVLVVNLSLTWQYRKLHWLFLGLALASASPIRKVARRARIRRRVLRAGNLPEGTGQEGRSSAGGSAALAG